MKKWEYKFIDIKRLPEFTDWEFCALMQEGIAGIAVLRRLISNGSAPVPWGFWGENKEGTQ